MMVVGHRMRVAVRSAFRWAVPATIALLPGFGFAPGLAAESAGDRQVLRIGTVGAHDPEAAVRRMKPLADYLGRHLPAAVEVVAHGSLNDLVDAQASGRIDLAAHSATSFAALRGRCHCAEAIAVPLSDDGMRHFYAVALTRREDKVSALTELRGRKVALGRKGSTASRRVPEAVLAGDGDSVSRFFFEPETYDDPVAALGKLARGGVDAVFTWSSLAGDVSAGYSRGPLRQAIEAGAAVATAVAVSWRSIPIPHGPVVVSAALPPDLRAALAGLLPRLLEDDPDAYHALDRYFGNGLAPPDRAVLRAFVELLGYDYDPPSRAAVPAEAGDGGNRPDAGPSGG